MEGQSGSLNILNTKKRPAAAGLEQKSSHHHSYRKLLPKFTVAVAALAAVVPVACAQC